MASPDASPRSYNASIAIQCVWGSFSSPPSNGYGLVDTIVPVQGFGKPLANCPNGSGSDATEGTTQIFFIYMQKGVMTGPNYYAVSNPCAGPLAYTPENLEMIAGILKASPANKMSDEFRGSKEQCILPTTVNGAPIAATSTKPRTVINIPPPASGAIHLIGSSLLVGLLTLSVMYL